MMEPIGKNVRDVFFEEKYVLKIILVHILTMIALQLGKNYDEFLIFFASFFTSLPQKIMVQGV